MSKVLFFASILLNMYEELNLKTLKINIKKLNIKNLHQPKKIPLKFPHLANKNHHEIDNKIPD